MLYIHVLDSVHCKADKPLINMIAPCLSYKRTHVRPGQFGAKKVVQDAYMVDRRNGFFPTGLLTRVCKYLDQQKVGWGLNYPNGAEGFTISPTTPPRLNSNYRLRAEQLQLINAATQGRRGVIKSPTGTGKTVMAMGFISQYPYHKTLILTHQLDLANQFYERMVDAGFDKRHMLLITEGQRPSLVSLRNRNYAIATVQTFSGYPLGKICDVYDIIIGDEIHHCQDRKSRYAEIYQAQMAPIKLGFTATLPESTEGKLSLEGVVGPVIGELNEQEAGELGIMAEPYITLINVPYNVKIGEYRRYRDLYKHGVVNNRTRNGLIVKAVAERVNGGKTCLVMIKEKDHGKNIMANAAITGLPITYIHGGTPGKDRRRVQELLTNRQIGCVMTTDIWREGVDIPTLNVVVNACGGKAEIGTLQAVGRGARRTAEKDRVEVIDCLDPYRYLAEHTVRRLQIYNEKGWL